MHSSPTLTTYFDKKSKRWHVNIAFPGGARYRPSLKLKADEEHRLPEALENFKAHVLPQYIDKHTAAAHTPRPTAAGAHLRELADWYTDTYLPYMDASPKTISNYRSVIQGFIAFAATQNVARAQQLSARLIQEWQVQSAAGRANGKPSRTQVLTLRRWLNRCEESGILDELPDILWAVPKKSKSHRFRALPRDVIGPWLDGLDAWRPYAGAVARWVDATGWRIGDALDLRVGEVDFARGVIDRQQLKTSSALDYPLTPVLACMARTALEHHEHPKRADALFLNHKGAPWQYQALVKVIENYQHSHWDGEHITFRDLRKSFGSRLAMEGCPPNVLQELMGHVDVQMTLDYYVDVDVKRMAKWARWHTENMG